jgi:hypothetical protein
MSACTEPNQPIYCERHSRLQEQDRSYSYSDAVQLFLSGPGQKHNSFVVVVCLALLSQGSCLALRLHICLHATAPCIKLRILSPLALKLRCYRCHNIWDSLVLKRMRMHFTFLEQSRRRRVASQWGAYSPATPDLPLLTGSAQETLHVRTPAFRSHTCVVQYIKCYVENKVSLCPEYPLVWIECKNIFFFL